MVAPVAGSKLTKKQKKAAAFRDRKSKGKAKSKLSPGDDDVADLPIADDQDLADALVEAEEVAITAPSSPSRKGKEKALIEPIENVHAIQSKGAKKRKREDQDIVPTEPVGEADEQTGGETNKPTKRRRNKASDEKSNGGPQRFILFLGNLKYTTTKEAITAHFSACDPPPQIRLLTPKPKAGAPPSAQSVKSKGCAFLEFTSPVSLQQALRLHHSVLDGRQINVELTAGGGGKGDARLTKLKERNKGLETQRTKSEKRKSKKSEETPEQELARLTAGKRYSATSGVEEAPTNQRTWTVGDVVEDTHRGGVKHKKERKRGTRVKSQASGMNAIPIG